MSHIETDELALYTAGALSAARTAAIDAHVETCDGCAAKLHVEAKIEHAVHELIAERACVGCGRAITVDDRCSHCGAAVRVGEFRILGIRVQNQHGRLYLAEDAAGTQVALKELCFMQAPSFEALDAFEREARILCALHHPAMPRFISSFQAGEGVHTRLYLAQEFIEGESLEERLAKHYFTEAEIVGIARQVMEIIAYLQKRSPMVIHRDIKPANLLRRPDGRIVLVDFGAARDQGVTGGATQVGTFGYMPIEQHAGLVDASTDVYALGMSLMRLLTRREPWKLLDDPWKHMNVSPQLRRVLRRMTERRPEDRYPDAMAALTDLIAMQAEPPRGRRRPVALTVGISLTIAVGAGLAYRVATRAPDPEPPTPTPMATPLGAPATCTTSRFAMAPLFRQLRAEEKDRVLGYVGVYRRLVQDVAYEKPRGIPASNLFFQLPVLDGPLPSSIDNGVAIHDGDLTLDAISDSVVVATGAVVVRGPIERAIVIAGGCVRFSANIDRSIVIGGGGVVVGDAIANAGRLVHSYVAGPAVIGWGIDDAAAIGTWVGTPRGRAAAVTTQDRWELLLTKLMSAASELAVPCDEVGCLLSNYAGACCARFKIPRPPPAESPDPQATKSPEALDRHMIATAVARVKPEVMDCGNRSTAKGRVKVHVRVKPDGGLGMVMIRDTPDAALGQCVAKAMQKLQFPRTQNGGSFSYPFVF